MKDAQLRRVLNIIKRTGDKLIFADNESDELFAVMDLVGYERLLDGNRRPESMTEKEIMDSIDRDLSLWRSAHFGEDASLENVGPNFKDFVEEDSSPVWPEELAKPKTEDLEIKTEKLVDNFGGHKEEEPLDDLSEEDSDTFLLEPV